MPFIESDLLKFIILVIPGIMGVWIYKPFLCRDHVPELWEHELMQALIFGVIGYIIAGYCYQNNWVSSIYGCIGVSFIVSVSTACILGELGRHNIFLSYIPAGWDSKWTQTPIVRPHGRAIEHFYQEFVSKAEDKERRVQVARLFPLGRENEAEIGVVSYKADKYNEIGLDCYPHLEYDFLEKNRESITLWTKIINLDTGNVIEIANVEKGLIEELRQNEFDEIFK